MPGLRLPPDYVARAEPAPFDDARYVDSAIIHQPEVYDAADYFLRAGRRSTVIDIGCGNGRKLREIRAARHVGIDFGANLALCRARFGAWGEWLEADFARPDCVGLAAMAGWDSVVVCADVVEQLADPEPLLALLAACYRRGAIVLTSTPDRVRTRGAAHKGPPPNPAHVREWALAEYVECLAGRGLPASHAGYTLNNSRDGLLKTIVTVHDITIDAARATLAGDRPVAILSSYNEADVIGEVVQDLLDQGCDVVAIDTWSTDGTWEILADLAARHGGSVRLERFPDDGPAPFCAWRKLLELKESLALGYAGRWVLHTDADELRRSPFPGLTLAEALHLAERTGANRVDFNLINFRPIDDRPFRPGTLGSGFSYFEYGDKPGHFRQAKAWRQGDERVELASSGGHSVAFPGAVDFPYKFLLRHYPIRSPEHGRRKVLAERSGRWSPEERAAGWHVQYDGFTAASPFLWARETLHEHDASFWQEHGLPLMTDIAERRFLAGRR